jgi:hypothetical protein
MLSELEEALDDLVAFIDKTSRASSHTARTSALTARS